MKFSLYVSLLLLPFSMACLSSEHKLTIDLKDDGKYCQATAVDGVTSVDIVNQTDLAKNHLAKIPGDAQLVISAVDNLCILRRSGDAPSMFVLSTNKGLLAELKNPSGFAESDSGNQLAIEYYDGKKRSVYFIDNKGISHTVSFSNYSVEEFGFGWHKLKYSPDDSELIITEGDMFAEKMIILSAKSKKRAEIIDVPPEIANIRGSVSFIDKTTAVMIEGGAAKIIKNLRDELKITPPDPQLFVGAAGNELVFLSKETMSIYNIAGNYFSEPIQLPTELKNDLIKNDIYSVEVENLKGNKFSLKSGGDNIYIFNKTSRQFKTQSKYKPCSKSFATCIE